MPASFVHLRVRSCYSLRESVVRIGELVALCAREGMPAVAVTDSANLFGVMEFCAAAKKAGVQPIVGALLPVRLELRARGANGGRGGTVAGLPLLVKDEEGYRNLCRLLSRAYRRAEEPGVEFSELEAAAGGLIALTGGAGGLLGRLLQSGARSEAEAVFARLRAAFGDRLYVEIQRHGLAEEDRLEEVFLDWAYGAEVPLVATNDVRLLEPDQFEALEAMLCIEAGVVLGDERRPAASPNWRFKSAAEMAELFADLPEAVANTLTIARRCAYAAPERAPILPRYPTRPGLDEAEELRLQAQQGLEERLARLNPAPDPEQRRRYEARLAYELDVIVRMRYPGYFLIVADFIRWAKGQGIPVGPGRGSGAGSLVAWALGITDLDPLRFGLLFERFLNPERVSMPDFDIDFCQDRRDEVIQYVRERYGADRVAHIITFGKLQARAVLRDVGRVLGLPYGLVDRICKLVPHSPANPVSLERALEMEPRLQEMVAREPMVARMIEIARKLEGLPRHASTHAAGVVIGDRPLEDLIPLYRDPRSEMLVTQFNMKDVEKAGLVKFDFLGLTTLTMLRLAERLIQEAGTPLRLAELPLDDPATFALLSRAETTGVFQLESGGMRDALRKLQPDRFEDIIAMVALYRPGPMDNIPRYINVKHGREQPSYLHPALEPILRETHGVIIYQEQVMEIARELAGYSLGRADLLRRAMGKKIQAEMDAQREVFIEGAVARGIDRELAGMLFDQVAKFASYGFNKSHAAAYALLAYQTAYVKANHPVEFFAAVMTMERGQPEKLAAYRQEMRRLGIPLYPPDVNASEVAFRVEEGADGRGVRYALAAIKGVGDQAVRMIVDERRRRGPFADVFDFAARLGPKALNRRLLEALIKAGAFDSLDPNRHRLYAAIDQILRHAQSAAADLGGQTTLFGDAGALPPPPPLPEVDDWPPLERLQEELKALGFYLSAHPLDGLAGAFDELGITPAGRLLEEPRAFDGRRLRLAGVVLAKKERVGARSRFAFVELSDPSGQFEITVFSELLTSRRELLEGQDPLLVEADARVEGEEIRLTAQSIEPLPADRLGAKRVEILVERPEALSRLRTLLGQEGLAVRLWLRIGADEEVALELPQDQRLPALRIAEAAALEGIADIRPVS